MSKMYDLLKAAEARRLVTVECEEKERQLDDLELGPARITTEMILARARSADLRATKHDTFVKSFIYRPDRTYGAYLAMILPLIAVGFLVVSGPRLFQSHLSYAQLGDNATGVRVEEVSSVSTVRSTDGQKGTITKEHRPVGAEVHQMVMQWADAWSRRDAAAYFSFYGRDFNLPSGVSRADWEALRQSRLQKYNSIEVILKNIKITFTGSDAASVLFTQDFLTNNYKEKGIPKELHLKKSQGRWFIVREKSLK
jgi:hypothetical protein